MSNTDSAQELPNWKCADCGESFSALTQEQLQRKVNRHQEDCDIDQRWVCEECGWSVREDDEDANVKINKHISECKLKEYDCPRCGQHYQAPTEERMDELIKQHKNEASCYSDPTYSPEANLPDQQIPRNPAAYRPTDHFGVRKAKREEPPVQSGVIKKLITDGVIKRTQEKSRFLFERKIDGWTWRLFVQLMDEAFMIDSKKHLVVTIYAAESDQHEVANDFGI